MLHTLLQAQSLASRFSLLLMLCSVFFVFVVNAQEQSDLKSIQQQIKNKQVQINQQLATAKTLQDNLKVIEIQIAKSATTLNNTLNAKLAKFLTRPWSHVMYITQGDSLLSLNGHAARLR